MSGKRAGDLNRLLTLLLLCAACRGSPPGDRRLVIFAAASLAMPFRQLADSFRAHYPGVDVELNLAGTQVLALQLFQGARADILASADQQWMDAVTDSGLVAGMPMLFARNHLALILPADNPAGIRTLADLARPHVKLVLPAPAVPAGRYAREAIANIARLAGSPPDYATRVLANVVSNEETVTGVVTKVRLGVADAGIVYVSDISEELRNSIRSLEIPGESNVTALYPIAVLRRAADPSLAQAFVGLVLSPAGQQVLQANGFRSGFR